MNSFKLKILFFISQIIFLSSCVPENSERFIVQKNQQEKNEKSYIKKVLLNTKVDILFVIDNSSSMNDEQKKIRNNIESFINIFLNNKIIDYHIGVTTVYDSTSFGPGKEHSKASSNGDLRALNFESILDDYPNIDLKKLKFSKEKKYLSRKTVEGLNEKIHKKYLVSLLKDLIFVGTKTAKEGGPLNEEILSPISAVLKASMNEGESSGFYRKDAHLAIVVLSDAEDESPNLKVESFVEDLKAFKGEDNKSKISVYGIISPTRYEDLGQKYASKKSETYGCSKDYNEVGHPEKSKNPLRVELFLDLMKAKVYSLCDENSFSEGLLEIGNDIKKKTLLKPISLSGLPDFKSKIEVRFGDLEIPLSKSKGWFYSPEKNQILFSEDLNLDLDKANHFSLKFTPINLLNRDL